MFIFIYICFADAVKIFHLENFRLFFQFTFKIQAFSSKLLSRFRHFLPRYFQDQIFSWKILQDQTFSCKILQDQTLSSKIFQDTCKNNAMSFKILEVKSDRFLQEMYGSSTGAGLLFLYIQPFVINFSYQVGLGSEIFPGNMIVLIRSYHDILQFLTLS